MLEFNVLRNFREVSNILIYLEQAFLALLLQHRHMGPKIWGTTALHPKSMIMLSWSLAC